MKIAVNLSRDELEALDAIGERTRRTRNAVIADAVNSWLALELRAIGEPYGADTSGPGGSTPDADT